MIFFFQDGSRRHALSTVPFPPELALTPIFLLVVVGASPLVRTVVVALAFGPFSNRPFCPLLKTFFFDPNVFVCQPVFLFPIALLRIYFLYIPCVVTDCQLV